MSTDMIKLARRVRALRAHLEDQPMTHADSVDLATLDEVAAALATQAEELRDWKQAAEVEASERREAHTEIARLREALKEAQQFIESEFRDPSQEAHGDWLAPEARHIHSLICEALGGKQ